MQRNNDNRTKKEEEINENLTYSGFLRSDEKFYSTGEEWANAITHALATVAAIVGLVFLTIYATDSNSPLVVTTVTIFGSSLILLYLASTLYHAIPFPRAKGYFNCLTILRSFF